MCQKRNQARETLISVAHVFNYNDGVANQITPRRTTGLPLFVGFAAAQRMPDPLVQSPVLSMSFSYCPSVSSSSPSRRGRLLRTYDTLTARDIIIIVPLPASPRPNDTPWLK